MKKCLNCPSEAVWLYFAFSSSGMTVGILLNLGAIQVLSPHTSTPRVLGAMSKKFSGVAYPVTVYSATAGMERT